MKIRRFSNIHSCIRIEPSAWVARATAIEVRSAGNAGHGPSWILRLVVADVGLRSTSFWPAGHDHVVAVELAAQPEPLEDEPDHAQIVRARCP